VIAARERLPTGVSENTTAEGDTANTNGGVLPVRDTGTGSPPTLSLMKSVADWEPNVAGAKATAISWLVPAPKVTVDGLTLNCLSLPATDKVAVALADELLLRVIVF
jgi:hypothetical protein